jgi:hypothetical protein
MCRHPGIVTDIENASVGSKKKRAEDCHSALLIA